MEKDQQMNNILKSIDSLEKKTVDINENLALVENKLQEKETKIKVLENMFSDNSKECHLGILDDVLPSMNTVIQDSTLALLAPFKARQDSLEKITNQQFVILEDQLTSLLEAMGRKCNPHKPPPP